MPISPEVPIPDRCGWGLSAEALCTRSTVYREDLLAGKAYVVSGAGSGIGRATTYLLTRLGASVMMCGRDEAKLVRVAAEVTQGVGCRPAWHAMNIRDREQVAALFEKAIEAFGHVDGLVNCAGGQFPQHAIDIEAKGWNAVVDTNLNGTWWMIQNAARHWRAQSRGGCIVSVVASFQRGIVQLAHTAAARAAVANLSRSLAQEWAPLGVRINCIAPGAIETEGWSQYSSGFHQRIQQANPMRRPGDAWDIAQAVVYLCSDAAKFVTGELLHVDGGMQLWGGTYPLGVPAHLRTVEA